MIKTPILLSEEIKNAGVLMSSIYEVNKPMARIRPLPDAATI
jgi:hypothetical protein